ncbi:F-box protein SKP2B [Abeliophyllum distichum]|uniref:F-box protein SKP2B n=1 Tax=Abeliophyllum distichum TaxID=126358 RepID=A0ABD1S8R2_9LAMI
MLVFGGGAGGGGRRRISEWKDIPAELLLRIVSLVDDRTVIVASGVCHGWRDAISWGLTHLSLSWCKKNMNNLVISLVPNFTKLQVLILRQDTPQLQDNSVESNCKLLPRLARAGP